MAQQCTVWYLLCNGIFIPSPIGIDVTMIVSAQGRCILSSGLVSGLRRPEQAVGEA